MPLYEYECQRDGRFELIRKYSDPPIDSCPTCGGAVNKLFSAPAIQFKGSGWYVTDYAKKSGGPGKSGEKSGEGKPGEKPAARSSESKDSGGSRSESSSSSGSSSSGSSSSSPSTDSK